MGQILFIVEGDNYEPKVLEHLWDNLVPQYAAAKVVYTWSTHIYQLYKELIADNDLSLIGILNERHPGMLPPGSDEDTFQEIYLIFDYDGHVNMPHDPAGGHMDGDIIITELLQYFDDENDNGRLFINYPMVEAVKHLSHSPQLIEDVVTAKCKGPHCPNLECDDRHQCPPVRIYKEYVNQLAPRRADMTKLSWQEWNDVFSHHIAVAAIITGLINQVVPQGRIFQVQLSQFISRPCPQVAVLSCFPLFFYYYLGAALFSKIAQLAAS